MRGFTVCPECASLRLRPVKASEGGAVPGLQFEVLHCRDCGWQGMPLEFDDQASWQAFVEARRGDIAGLVACPACGERGVEMVGPGQARCPHCWWSGQPVRFRTEEEYLAFALARKNASGARGEAG